MALQSTTGLWLTHNLTLLYLALAYGTDHELSPAERESVAFKLRRWFPDLDPAFIGHVLREAHLTYLSGLGMAQLWSIVESLRSSLTRDTRARVLSDFSELTQAEGLALDAEGSLIARIAAAWGFDARASLVC